MSTQLDEERKQYVEQLEIVNLSLKESPGNAELLSLKDELKQMISMLDESLAELKPAPPQPKPTAKPPPAPPKVEEKWSRENHPAFKKAAEAAAAAAAAATATPAALAEELQPEVYNVNDAVMAKWVTGDKGFYAARITSVTGSSTNPIYTVKFKSYDTVETLKGKDIRPATGVGTAGQKRKVDGAAGSAAVPTPPPLPGAASASGSTGGVESGFVLSAPANLYPQAQQAANDEGGADGPKKFKKIKAKKELEAGKNKWQEFNAKGKFGKSTKKDSMFRTPDGVGGRVGFTGSGQAMRKDPTRSRHIYQPNEELD